MKKQAKTFLDEAASLAPRFYALTRVNGTYAMVTLDLEKESIRVSEEDIFSLASSKFTREIRKDLGI